MSEPEPLTQQQREDLVAYLDGELDDESSGEIEKTLADSAEARREVEMLTRSWEMLNVLEKPEASEEFTSKTLAEIHVDEAEAAPAGEKKRLLVPLLWGAAIVAAAAAGFVAARYGIEGENDGLVRELRIIENYDVYSDVGSVEFLQELEKSELFDEELTEQDGSTNAER